MIDINKKYRTRNGREVRIYATDHTSSEFTVGGAVREENGWAVHSWTADGRYFIGPSLLNDDLVEVKPRIQRTVWLNVYLDYAVCQGSREDADDACDSLTRIACIQVAVDCDEGEGLGEKG